MQRKRAFIDQFGNSLLAGTFYRKREWLDNTGRKSSDQLA
jgi:hypothetical protein